MVYEVRFAESAKAHLRALTARQRRKAIEAIETRLTHEPLNETRNRKPLRPNPLAPWELRIGKLRVFYDVAETEPGSVNIVAVGEKRGNR
ncbi:MAG: type II toxin-antitoxin system RelE family toxin, partial [Blastocatellia bacterium]